MYMYVFSYVMHVCMYVISCYVILCHAVLCYGIIFLGPVMSDNVMYAANVITYVWLHACMNVWMYVTRVMHVLYRCNMYESM